MPKVKDLEFVAKVINMLAGDNYKYMVNECHSEHMKGYHEGYSAGLLTGLYVLATIIKDKGLIEKVNAMRRGKEVKP